MKYPLPRNLFPPLTLTEGQEEQYERLAHSIVKETMADYDHFWGHDRRVVDATRWKPIKRKEHIVVYRDRARDASVVTRGSSRGAMARANTAPPIMAQSHDQNDEEDEEEATNDAFGQTMGFTSSAFSITDRRLQHESAAPKLLAVGSIRGNLDDVMYGIASPNASSMRLKTSYVDDEIVDGAVLYQMKGPTPAEPFRFLGIKWMVKETQGAVKSFVRPRDFIVLEFASVMLRPNGDRIGFHLMHSVEIPTCRELLREHNILRAKVSSCYLYRERADHHNHGGVVDLYMTAKVEPRGKKVLEAMAIRAAATALSRCLWNSVLCAQSKKLAWLLQNDQTPRFSSINNNSHSSMRSSTYPTATRTGDDTVDELHGTRLTNKQDGCCSVCSRSFGSALFLLKSKKSSTCQLCYEPMCARCRVYKKLSSETLDTNITKTSMVFCTRCITGVTDESAADIAKQEIWEGRYRSRTRTRASSAATTFGTRSSSAHPSLYDAMYDPRASERSTYSSIFDENEDDDNKSTTSRVSWASTTRTTRTTSSPQGPRRSTGKRLSWRLSGGPVTSSSRGTAATEALSLAELDVTQTYDNNQDDDEPPILLIEPATRDNLRALDYVVPPKEEDLDGLESTATSSEHQDDSEDGRMSYTSSIALMDSNDEYDGCEPHQGILVHSNGDDDFRVVHEEGEEEAENDGEEIYIVNNSTSTPPTQERISEVHAIVKAQSAIYDNELAMYTPPTTTATSAAATDAPASSDDAQSSYQSRRKLSYQMQLWMQMHDLRDAAETTYQVTKRNTDALLMQQQRTNAFAADSDKPRPLRSYSQPFQFGGVVGLRPGRAMSTMAKPQQS
ncbi:hypothetical protein FI667_g8799, partial [Globisporangium splendens]